MWSIPNLFHKKIEKLGKNCSQEQSVAISQLKDLFLGMDTLKTFGRGEKFLGKSESISDNIERPNYILNATKANNFNVFFIMFVFKMIYKSNKIKFLFLAYIHNVCKEAKIIYDLMISNFR